MKTILKLGLALLLPVSSWAQSPGTGYRDGGSALDSAGNLVVFDEGRSTTAAAVTDRRSFFPPITRVTIQHPGSSGNIQTVSYDAAVRLAGVSNSAIYAIAT